MPDYELRVLDSNLALVSLLWPRQGEIPPTSIRWTRNWRSPGVLELHIPRETDLIAELSTIGNFIEVRRDGNFEAIYLIRAVEITSGALTYSRGVLDSYNAVYAGGQGAGTDRLLVLKENAASLAEVGRIERFIDARDVEYDDLALLQDRASAAMSEASVPESAVANVGAPAVQDMITVWGVSPLIYAAGRVVLPPPATRQVTNDLINIGGDDYDRAVNEPADVAMVQYVREHLTDPNDPTRKVPLLATPIAGGVLPLTSYTSRFQTVLEVLQDLGANNNAGFEIIKNGIQLEFVVRPVRDRTATSANPVILRDDEVLLDIPGRAYRSEWDVGDRITLELRNGYRVDLRVFEVAGELRAGRAIEISLGVVLEASGNLIKGIIDAATSQNKSLVRIEEGYTPPSPPGISAKGGGIVHYDYVVDPNNPGGEGDLITLATGSTAKVYSTVQMAIDAAVVDGTPGAVRRSILLNAGTYPEDVIFPATLTSSLWLHGEAVNKVSIQSIYIQTTQEIHFKNIRVLAGSSLASLGIALIHDAGGASTWDISYAATPWSTVALPATVTSQRPRPWCLTDQLWFVSSVGGFPDPTSQSAGSECDREMVRSVDGGATWAATVVGDETCTTERAHSGDEINHFSRVAIDAGGRVWAARKRGSTTAHPVRTEIWSSDSQGATLTWTLRGTLTLASSARNPYALLCHPTDQNIIVLISASEYAPAGGDKGVVVYYSLDRGASWSTSTPTVASGNNFALTAEPPNGQSFRAMVLPSGRIVIASRETTASHFIIITSDDNGVTWQLRHTDAEVNEDNMLLFTQGQWLNGGQHLVGIRVPVQNGVTSAWAIMESFDSGTTWSIRAVTAPTGTLDNDWDAVYDPISDKVIVQDGNSTTTNRVLSLAAVTTGGNAWQDVTGDLPSNIPTLMHWEGIALIPSAVSASVMGNVATETHWEDCEIEGELTLELHDSSFRRTVIAKYSPTTGSTDMVFSDCKLTESQIWDAAELFNHDFVNTEIALGGSLVSSGGLFNFHFTNCPMPAIQKSGGAGVVTFGACGFPAPAGATGTVHIASCLAGTAFQFLGGGFTLNGTNPFLYSADPDFEVVIQGFDLVDNVAAYIVGQFKNSVFGPCTPPDFKVQVD